MVDNIYNITEIVGTSPDGTDTAIANAIEEASKTLHNLDWFEVQSVRGNLNEGHVVDWQVTIKIGFRHETKGE
ncbi:dodecin [Yaniella halotolerans]|uniref:dodecin n=1 Tax=Yaniella halotolerans TaxID=225453 RepID=UPI0003B3DDE3|nr:dodecin [Yaniella halotolerans]